VVVIFDVDGTILDTYPLVRASYIHTFKKYLPEYEYDEKLLKSFFGPPLPDTFKKVTSDDELIKLLILEYQKFSNENAEKYLKTFPNLIPVLKNLKSKGHKLAVLSNKHSEAIRFEFKTLGIFPYFDFIIGYNDVVNPKPHPEGIYKIKEKFKEDCIFVGDSIYDIEAAKNANVKIIIVSWANLPESVKVDYVIDEFSEILEIIEGGKNV